MASPRANSRLYSSPLLLYPLATMTNRAYFPAATHLFEMKGPDARDFLHRLTTADVRRLEPGDYRPAFFLNPPGRIRAALRIGCRAPDSFYLETEGGEGNRWKDALLAVIDQYTFAEKYELRELVGLSNAWIFGLASATENRFDERVINGKTLLLFNASQRSFSGHWTSAWGPSTEIDRYLRAEAPIPLEEAEFERFRIRNLFPRVDRELVMEANPLELGLREAIADNKGCYPGQEVIEKIVSLGAPAKRLALLTGSGPAPSVGSVLRTAGGTEAGTVTSVCGEHETAFSALALLRKTTAIEGQKLMIAGHPSGVPIELDVERVAEYE